MYQYRKITWALKPGLFFILTFAYPIAMSAAKRILLLFLILCAHLAIAQPVNTDTLRAKDNVMFPLPTISVNVGIANVFSDVLLTGKKPSAFQQLGYQLSISQRVVNYLNVSLNIFAGTAYGEEQREQTNLNYKTTLFSQQLNVAYNFYPLLKPNEAGRQLIRPYIGLGVGLLSFRAKGDLKDSQGNTYHYWQDGNIYAQPEGSIAPSEATPIERDFVYETDLRDANLDGLRKYPQTAFSLPFHAGIRFQITKNFGLNAAFSYVLNFTDMVDNVSPSGEGNRQGTKGNDNHIFGSVGVSVFLGNTKPSTKPVRFDNQLAESKAPSASTADTAATATVIEKSHSQTASTSDSTTAVSPSLSLQKHINSVGELRRKISSLQQELAKNQNDIKLIKGRITREKKISKASRVSIQELWQKQPELVQQLNEVQQTLSELNQTDYSSQISALEKPGTKEVDTPAEAQASLDKLAAQFTKIQKELAQYRVGIRDQESKLNRLAVIKAKIRLMEKVKTDTSAASRLTDTELTSKASALAAELETLHADSTLMHFVSKQDIATLHARAQTIIHQPKKEMASLPTEQAKTHTQKATDNAQKSHPTTKEIENTPPKISGGFMWADVNGNGWISPDEVLHFIDLLFEGNAVRTVEDIQNLIEYYFDQE